MSEFKAGDRIVIDEAGDDVSATVTKVLGNGDLWCKADDGTTYRVPQSMVKLA